MPIDYQKLTFKRKKKINDSRESNYEVLRNSNKIMNLSSIYNKISPISLKPLLLAGILCIIVVYLDPSLFMLSKQYNYKEHIMNQDPFISSSYYSSSKLLSTTFRKMVNNQDHRGY